jgi:hypothetical protein
VRLITKAKAARRGIGFHYGGRNGNGELGEGLVLSRVFGSLN